MSDKPISEEKPATVGEILKRKRREKKLSLEEVHKNTKLSLDVLKSIEQDDFGGFESEIYLKGFLRNYAGYLGLDADYLFQLLEGQRGDGQSSGGTTWDIEESVREERLESPRLLTRVVVPLLVIIILILSILYALERRKVKALQGDLGRMSGLTQVLERHDA